MKQRPENAIQSMSRLRSLPPSHPEVLSEIEDIISALNSEREMGQSSYLDCFRSSKRNKIALRTISGIALQAWQQLTGVNFISYCEQSPRLLCTT